MVLDDLSAPEFAPHVREVLDSVAADGRRAAVRARGAGGQPFDDRARSCMDAYQAEHPRGRHGGVRYDPATVGLDRAELDVGFAAYRERFAPFI